MRSWPYYSWMKISARPDAYIDKALIFAAKAHDGQYRKGTNIPYIAHPVALGHNAAWQWIAPETVVIAALLHGCNRRHIQPRHR